MTGAAARGTLHLVVGPSGAGKDTLIDAARAARPDILFPTRVITRPADAGGEAHEALDEAGFEARAARGDFALWWRAHGLGYGVPGSIGPALAAGRHVVVNVSRGVVAEARRRFAPIRVLVVTASPDVLAARLAGRGRETASDIAARLARAPYTVADGPDVRVILNDGLQERAAAAFRAALMPAR